jgi:hypothetical protein
MDKLPGLCTWRSSNRKGFVNNPVIDSFTAKNKKFQLSLELFVNIYEKTVTSWDLKNLPLNLPSF